eukprot:7198843-Lingulodinium_polyedra.AAC.1
MDFRFRRLGLCITSHAPLFENEDSRTPGGQYWQLRVGFPDCPFRVHGFPASEARGLHYVTRFAV